MEKAKCRICLAPRKRFRSLHDCLEKIIGMTYADIVASISNVKVLKTDEISTVCYACCKRLTDIYEFRCQIERSDIELQKTCQIKRIVFADVQDIKCKIEIEEYDIKYEKPLLNYLTERFVRSSKKSLSYNSTIINKLKTETPDGADKKTLTVKAFLESIKEDPDNEYDITYDVDVNYDPKSDVDVNYDPESDVDVNCYPVSDVGDDEDYNPNKKKYIYKKKPKSGKDKAENQMPIKPVYLKDIRVERTKLPIKKRKKCKLKSRNRKHMCSRCGKMVLNTKSHMLTHTAREKCLKCDQCTKSFYTKSTLINHHLNCHGNKNYQCDKCVAVLRSIYSLKMHQMVHTGLVPKIPCETCGKTFRSNDHLKRHCQGVHNMGAKQFACDQCTMTFVTKYKLNHHMRVHTGERPHKCEICSQPYSYRTDFVRHCFKKHGVFLKGRKVNLMNEEVLVREQTVMKNLMLQINGIQDDGKPINPFEGPHSVKAFEQAVKALEASQIQINV